MKDSHTLIDIPPMSVNKAWRGARQKSVDYLRYTDNVKLFAKKIHNKFKGYK